MKAVLRQRRVRALMAWLSAAYVGIIISTVRWRFEGREAVDVAMDAPEGIIGLFWHGRIIQGMACRPLLGRKAVRVMISLSRDGELIALAAERLRIPTIRGSGGRGESARYKGGASAYRQALAFIAEGGAVILDPRRSARTAGGATDRPHPDGAGGGMRGVPHELGGASVPRSRKLGSHASSASLRARPSRT